MRGLVSVKTFLLTISMLAAAIGRGSPAADEMQVLSPDGRLSITLSLGAKGIPGCQVGYDGKVVVKNSSLGLVMEDGALGPFRQLDHQRSEHDETYPLIAGKSSSARDHYVQEDVGLEELAGSHRRMRIILRAYDDAAAFRYVLPEQEGMKEFSLVAELSDFALPAESEAWWQPLGDFHTPHEGRYHHGKLSDVIAGQMVGLPLLYHAPSGPWVGMVEANLKDYGGLYLKRGTGDGDDAIHFAATLAPLPGGSKVVVKGKTPHASPWRVFLVGDTPGRLIESNAVLNLSDPCALKDTSWIKPGKVSFLWWNGYVVAPPATVGPLNTATILQYVDFAADHHIQFASIDGSDHAWYGGPCAPYRGADVSKPLPEVDMPAIFAHATERGVRMRIWVNYHGLKLQIDKALTQYAQWGAEGVMVDMIERDDQENVKQLRRIIQKCAELHMTVTLHNVIEPTGWERTYPNLRTSEAVLNEEYNKWDPIGSPAEHELTVPFIRMLAGPLDFHQGGFRSVLPEDFKPHKVAPVVMGTRCHQMAMYVVYEDALPMIVDFPAAYAGQEGFDFICNVPTTWDETRVIDGTVGQEITIARQKGREWYVGSMAANAVKQTQVPLSFLEKDVPFEAEVWEDDAPHGPNAVVHRKSRVTCQDVLTFEMSADGGHVVHLTPVLERGN